LLAVVQNDCLVTAILGTWDGDGEIREGDCAAAVRGGPGAGPAGDIGGAHDE
jgi:hypothetical protein